jgi:hypothetical protein
VLLFVIFYILQNSNSETAQELDVNTSELLNEKMNDDVTSTIKQDSNSSSLKEAVYPTTSNNPSYTLLFAKNITLECKDATRTCGELIGNFDGGRDIQIRLTQASLSNTTYSPQEDKQCDEIDIGNEIAGLEYFCKAGSPSAGTLYYSFEINLEGQLHYGIFTGINPKGIRFLDVGIYEKQLLEIIKSIKLK